jgi:hypothetical protein
MQSRVRKLADEKRACVGVYTVLQRCWYSSHGVRGLDVVVLLFLAVIDSVGVRYHNVLHLLRMRRKHGTAYPTKIGISSGAYWTPLWFL